MITFVNTFLTYLILVIANAAVIVVAVLCGKKLREMKDAKAAAEEGAVSAGEKEN